MKDYIVLHQHGKPIVFFLCNITDIESYRVRVNRANYFEYTVDEDFNKIMEIIDKVKCSKSY